MLRPSKHSHPDRTIINVGLRLLTRVRSKRIDKYEDLKKFSKKITVGGEVLFLPAVNFLFLLGLIDYKEKTDSFEYVGPNEAL